MRHVAFATVSRSPRRIDYVGTLLAEKPDGWHRRAMHLSSSLGWAQEDLLWHYQQRTDPDPDPSDTYEWLGVLAFDDAKQRFPPPPDYQPENDDD